MSKVRYALAVAAEPSAPAGTGTPVFVPVGQRLLRFSRGDWWQLAGYYGFILLLHVVGWGLYLHHAAGHPALVGLGFAAYVLGLRHAFDADHIAAVDDTVRYLLQKGRSPLGVGFFFSLGHSSVVFALAVGVVFAAQWVMRDMAEWRTVGSLIGVTVSGLFLWVIGILNLLVLLDLLDVWKRARSGRHSHDHLEQLLARRGLMNRLFGGRLQKLIDHSWQMYPLGLLFGLGFDTASEIALLAMTAGAAAGNLPALAVLSLPILFAAGMSAMDTTDGVLMCRAYNWAFVNPLRKIFYNLTTTAVSVVIALVIGSIELLQVLVRVLSLQGPVFDFVAELDFGVAGYVIVGILILAWVASVAIWKFSRIDQRPDAPLLHRHSHVHADGSRHTHEHFH